MYTEFDKRMKKYEFVTRTYLYTRSPAIIRIDGKAFHTFTRGFQKPFDDILCRSMQNTMLYLCGNIQGCVLGYTQSDEITLVLVDYKELDTAAWFDYNIQKCSSIAASMATMVFNREFRRNAAEAESSDTLYKAEYIGKLKLAAEKGAMFDARIFNIPKEEVCNNLLWRQNDAARNSVQMMGRAYFSDKELHKKSCSEIREMLLTQKGIDWESLPTHYKHGSCCIRIPDEQTGRNNWVIDSEIPVFKGDDRRYVNDLIYVGE